MRILADTNILLDAVIGREPFFRASDTVIKLCASGKIEGYMAAHSIPNMFYILRKYFSEQDRRTILLSLCQIFKVAAIDQNEIIRALKNIGFTDFEDCLQAECAETAHVDYIITRNIGDFKMSPIPCLTAEEFCKKIEATE